MKPPKCRMVYDPIKRPAHTNVYAGGGVSYWVTVMV